MPSGIAGRVSASSSKYIATGGPPACATIDAMPEVIPASAPFVNEIRKTAVTLTATVSVSSAMAAHYPACGPRAYAASPTRSVLPAALTPPGGAR